MGVFPETPDAVSTRSMDEFIRDDVGESLTQTRYTALASQSRFRRGGAIERTDSQSFRRISYPPIVSEREPEEDQAGFCGEETRIRASRTSGRCFWTARTTSTSGGTVFTSMQCSDSRIRRTRGTSSEPRSVPDVRVGQSVLRTYSRRWERSDRD